MNRSTGTTAAAPFSRSGWSMYGPPEMAHAPTAITIIGAGSASYVFFKAISMFFDTQPVTSTPAACRGEATT
jgi:hypothetical protein